MTPRVRAGLVIAAVTASAVLGPASTAQAAWREVTHHPDLASCEQAGRDGVASGEWDAYYCKYVWGDWLLWVHYPD